MFCGLRADGRRPGLGLCGNSWARCDDLAGSARSPRIAPPRRAVAPPMRYFGWGARQKCRAPSDASTAVPGVLYAHVEHAQALAASLDARSGKSWSHVSHHKGNDGGSSEKAIRADRCRFRPGSFRANLPEPTGSSSDRSCRAGRMDFTELPRRNFLDLY
jgi:hypothetical protein